MARDAATRAWPRTPLGRASVPPDQLSSLDQAAGGGE